MLLMVSPALAKRPGCDLVCSAPSPPQLPQVWRLALFTPPTGPPRVLASEGNMLSSAIVHFNPSMDIPTHTGRVRSEVAVRKQ